MGISYSLGSVLSINEVMECATIIGKHSPDTVWIPETWGMENFSMLTMASQKINNARIGSSIINIYSRSPALIAMGAVTVDTISKGRLILGLGTSSVPIVEDFHGGSFKNPLSRMSEYIDIINLVVSKKKIDFTGKFFNLKGFTLLVKPIREKIPIYIAAVNRKMTQLAWDKADGVIFYLRPLNELKETIKKFQSKRKIDVGCQIITAIDNDAEKAIERAKITLAFYVSVGKIYREFLEKNGFANEVNNIYDEFKISGLKSNHELVTDGMLKALTICGTPNDGIKKIEEFTNSGVTHPILQFNPVGEVHDSVKTLTKTFSGIGYE
ncbi:MAG: LLM class flavin-dependent oxidoreductase [Crenarchaeota archaeon]|nr:MAG: LLM class flavin-dependent oxidoreductase [Thermoproteota archaeon]RDJ34145.1 MAG: LLM class flavin-dependent oxidoreductase [Thermoproteota archaeon]RDJ36739.1 MAG: LLM class flavin-dependent oxidoreductase [Thermoproteota archaeon]RDJ37727.1 MAG: LLM class flavin-dependent oxidoreductase [Thermoproteota archaeon]